MSNASKDFSANIRARLKAKNLTVIGSTWLPGSDGSFANGERGYQLNHGGCLKIRTFVQVLTIARGKVMP